MADGAELAQKYNDEAFWGDGDNDEMKSIAEEASKLSATEFLRFYENVDDRGELRATMEQENLDDRPDLKDLYEAMEDDSARNAYVRSLWEKETNFSNEGGSAAPIENVPHLDGGLVNLWIPQGATPLLELLITDTQNAMQDSINTLGTGDPDSWKGFTNLLEGEAISEASGWSNIREDHADLKNKLNERKEQYVEKNKEVDVEKYEADVLGKDLFGNLIGIKDRLNNEHLKIDLAEIFKDHGYGFKGEATASADAVESGGDGAELDPSKVDANYIVADQGAKVEKEVETEVNGKKVKTTVVYENTHDQGILYSKATKGGDDEKAGLTEGLFYLTPEAEWNFYARHVRESASEWRKKYDDASDEYQHKSDKVDDEKGGDEDKGGKGTYDDGYKAGLEAGRKENPGPTTPGPTTPGPTTPGSTTPGATTPGAKTPGAEETQDFSKTFDDLLGKEDPADGTGNETGKDGKDGKDGKGGSALEQVLQPIRDAITGSGATGATAAGAPAGDGGMGVMMPMMMMGMMSQMMQQAMQQQKQDEAAERDREEREREDEEPQSAPAPNAGPAPAAPAAPPPGTTAPPVQTDAPPAPPAPDTPKSMVDMKLPDGSSQRVSSVVSEAINRELNNPNGSDARAAYQGTPGEATAGSPWVSVESSAVATGDIAQWENRSALVVVTDSGLQAIVNGQMVPLDPHNPPDGGQGGYGEFRGFFHPSGADISGTNETAVGATPPEPPAIATAAPPAAAAAPPAVPPPATMEVR